jgi:hypothetical protein
MLDQREKREDREKKQVNGREMWEPGRREISLLFYSIALGRHTKYRKVP